MVDQVVELVDTVVQQDQVGVALLVKEIMVEVIHQEILVQVEVVLVQQVPMHLLRQLLEEMELQILLQEVQ
tara:strand:+ start:300 stop:512 length:213 start_codon:yes stop_codon:yes gene_type:complete